MEDMKLTISPLVENQEHQKESINALAKAVDDIVGVLAPLKKNQESLQRELSEIKEYTSDNEFIQELQERIRKLEIDKVNRVMKKIRSNEEILDTELDEIQFIVKRTPENPDLLLTLGILFSKKGKLENALETFQRIIEIDSKNQHAICLLGQTLLRVDKPKEAFDAFEKSRNISDCPIIYRHEAYSLAIRDNNEKAIELINLALKGNNKDALSWALKGRILRNMDRNMEALGCLENALELQPNLSIALTDKGLILTNLTSEYWEEGLNCLTKVTELEPDEPFAWHNKGMALSQIGDLEASLESLENAIRLDKQNACSYCLRANIFCFLGKNSEALDDLNKAFELGLPKDCSFYYLNKSENYKILGDPENALKEIENAIAIDPNTLILLAEKAIILNKLGKNDEAKECCEKVILSKPTKPFDLNHTAYALYKIGEYTRALEFAERAFQIDPVVSNIDTLACIFFKLGDDKKSSELFEKVLDMRTNDFEVSWPVLEKLYKKQGKLEKAEEAKEHATRYCNYY